MEEKPQIAPFPLRMGDDLRKQVTALAKASGRSVNAEIVQRLEQSMAMDKAAEQAMSGDPLDGIVALCEHIVHGTEVIKTLALDAGIQSGKVKVTDD